MYIFCCFYQDLNLQFHDISTGRGADHSGADVDFVFVQTSDISGIVEMVVHGGVIAHAATNQSRSNSQHSELVHTDIISYDSPQKFGKLDNNLSKVVNKL